MKQLKSTFWNMVWSLTFFTALAGGLLGFSHQLTKEPIAQAEKTGREKAIQAVLPPYDNSPLDEQYNFTKTDKDSTVVYPAYQGDVLVGAAVECSNFNGYSGEIRIIIGFNTDGTIRDYKVLKHAETPGLGAKMDQWFRTEKANQNIIGVSPATSNLTVKKDNGDVDAITAATITSRAFLGAVNTAYEAFVDLQKGGNHE